MERVERRRFIRLEVPIDIQYNVLGQNLLKEVTTKDISCDGLRFVTTEPLGVDSRLRLTIWIPKARNPVHAEAKIVWAKRQASAEAEQYEVGVELSKIEEDNKNTFLKYLCDIIYAQTEQMKSQTKVKKSGE